MHNIAVSCPPGEARDIARRYFKIALNNYDESKANVREKLTTLLNQDGDAFSQILFLHKVCY